MLLCINATNDFYCSRYSAVKEIMENAQLNRESSSHASLALACVKLMLEFGDTRLNLVAVSTRSAMVTAEAVT